MADSSPYSERFTSSTASRSLRMVEIGTTGPKVSCRAISMSSVTPSRTVGSKNRSLPCWGARRPPVTRDAPRPSASVTCRSVLAAVGSLFSGPMVVASSNGSPSRTRAPIAETSPAR